jgi:hypothetical protein
MAEHGDGKEQGSASACSVAQSATGRDQVPVPSVQAPDVHESCRNARGECHRTAHAKHVVPERHGYGACYDARAAPPECESEAAQELMTT